MCRSRLSGEQGGHGNWIWHLRPSAKFLALLADPSVGRIVIEHKDRGTRFGFRYVETLLKAHGRDIEVINQAEDSTEDLLSDLTSIVSSFCARLYGQRRAKRVTERIMQQLEAQDASD